MTTDIIPIGLITKDNYILNLFYTICYTLLSVQEMNCWLLLSYNSLGEHIKNVWYTELDWLPLVYSFVFATNNM